MDENFIWPYKFLQTKLKKCLLGCVVLSEWYRMSHKNVVIMMTNIVDLQLVHLSYKMVFFLQIRIKQRVFLK